ncbi:MAG: hypothetical protein AAGI91_12930 [Bacteroidota bacterium]
MSGRQLRVALAVLVPTDLPSRFDLRPSVTVVSRDQFVESLRDRDALGDARWRRDLRAALDHLTDPDDFRQRYVDAGGPIPEESRDEPQGESTPSSDVRRQRASADVVSLRPLQLAA